MPFSPLHSSYCSTRTWELSRDRPDDFHVAPGSLNAERTSLVGGDFTFETVSGVLMHNLMYREEYLNMFR
jgi:hypothetical protein